MNALIPFVLFFAAVAPTNLEQVRADPNPEHRARAAVDFAIAAEKDAESAYAAGDIKVVSSAVNAVLEAMELARSSFETSGRTPGRHPGPYKYAELHTRDLLIRLADLDRRMDADERQMLDKPRARIQEIHDQWFEGIMGKKK